LAFAAVGVPGVIDVEPGFPVGSEDDRVVAGADEFSGEGVDHAGLVLALAVEVSAGDGVRDGAADAVSRRLPIST